MAAANAAAGATAAAAGVTAAEAAAEKECRRDGDPGAPRDGMA
jgi:hypothetical protein